MKRLFLLFFALCCCLVSNAQTLYEVKYYDKVDNENYIGLFVYNDDDDCYFRCITENADETGNQYYYESSYCVDYQTENGQKYIVFVSTDENEDVTFPTFVIEYSKSGDFGSTYVMFQDEDGEVDEETMSEADYFEEIDLNEQDDDYFEYFFDKNDPMLETIMGAKDIIKNQNTNNTSVNNRNSDITMHFILTAATQDESIGESVKTDVKLVKTKFSSIAENLGINYEETIISDNNFCKENLVNSINNLSVNPNDIIVFIYSGHGFRFDDDTDEYPRMYLRYEGNLEGGDYMSTTDVYNQLVDKGAKLTLVFTDCCNSEYGATRDEIESAAFGTRASGGNTDIQKLKALFIDQSGSLRATAAKAGQYALCDASGGFLLTSIINNIQSQVSALSKEEPSWSKIIENASSYVKKKTSNQIDEAGNTQEPQIVVRSIKLNGENVSSSNFVDSKNIDNTEDDDDIWYALGFLGFIGLFLVLLITVIILLFKRRKK
ncbi:MAG: caspase family protein [Bacteroidales bacterium]|nr:caspase family protein [Bacteroidales bacterium]